jgi:hypothetical protein
VEKAEIGCKWFMVNQLISGKLVENTEKPEKGGKWM